MSVAAESTSRAADTAAIAGDVAFSGASAWPMAILSLLGIIALIVCLGWLARRFSGGSLISHRSMKVVATLPMGTRERLVLVDIAGQQLLLGVTAQNITHLHTFESPVVNVGGSPVDSDFVSKLKQFMSRAETDSKTITTSTHHADSVSDPDTRS